MNLTSAFAGKQFVRISPITGAKTEGVVKDLFYTLLVAEEGTLRIDVHLRATTGVVYDLKDCRIVPAPAVAEKLKALRAMVRLKPKTDKP